MDELDKRRRELSQPQALLDALSKQEGTGLPDQLPQGHSSKNFESSLRQAMQVPVAEDLAQTILLKQKLRKNSKRVFFSAMAASLAVISWGIWMALQPALPLPQAALAHVYHESSKLENSTQLSQQSVANRLATMGIELAGLPTEVTYAARCGLGGEQVMHLIVSIGEQAVTLLITPLEIEQGSRFGDSRFIGQMRRIGDNNLIAIAEDVTALETLFNQLSATSA